MYYKMWQMSNRHPSISCTYSHRCLEAEGMEKTHRFKQEDIAESVPLANSQQVCTPVDSLTPVLGECAGTMGSISLLS